MKVGAEVHILHLNQDYVQNYRDTDLDLLETSNEVWEKKVSFCCKE